MPTYGLLCNIVNRRYIKGLSHLQNLNHLHIAGRILRSNPIIHLSDRHLIIKHPINLFRRLAQEVCSIIAYLTKGSG